MAYVTTESPERPFFSFAANADMSINPHRLSILSAEEVDGLYNVPRFTIVGYLTNRAGGAAYPAVTASVFEESTLLVPAKKLIISMMIKLKILMHR